MVNFYIKCVLSFKIIDQQIKGLVQDCIISSALAMDIPAVLH